MVTEQEHRQAVFDLLDIIHEQGEAISLLLLKVESGEKPDPEIYKQMVRVHNRTRTKVLRMGAKIGWQPGQETEVQNELHP